MTPKRILVALLLLTVLDGMADARYAAHPASGLAGWQVASAFLSSFLCFLWYRRDSDTRCFVRSRWLSVGVVNFAIAGIPYYLLRSRPAGVKMRALLRCVGFAMLIGVAYVLGIAVSGLAF